MTTLHQSTVTLVTKVNSPFNVLPNVDIQIRDRLANGSSGGLSSIFSDQAGLSPITQTGATTNDLGQFTFFAQSGFYNAIYINVATPVEIAIDVGLVISQEDDTQILSNGQTVVTFGTGVDVNISQIFLTSLSGDRGRLVEGEDYSVSAIDVIELTKSYPAGTKCVAFTTELANSSSGLSSIVDVLKFGAKGDGVTDDTAAINAAISSIPLGGTIRFPSGVYLISGTITLNVDNIILIGDGEGTIQGGIATLRSSAATRILFSNLSTPAPMVEFTSVEAQVPKSGGGIIGIMLDCNGTASDGLVVSSWRKGQFKHLHIYAPGSRGIHTRAFAGTLTSEPYDTQHNVFDTIEVHSKNIAGTHIALLMTGGEGDGGANAGNSSFNYFRNCHFTSENNTAMRLENTDNNYFYGVRAGGSASFFSLVLETNEGTTGNARFNQFHGGEFTGKGVNAKAAQSGGLSSFDNYFFGLSRSNGAPKPTVGKGAGGSPDASIIVDGIAEFDFIPTVEGTSTAGTATYATQVGRVTRDADRVQFELKVDFSAFTGTGNLIVQGLPFTHDAVVAVGVFSVISENLTFSNQLAARMISNTGTIELVTISTGAAAVSVPVDSAAILQISGAYMTQDNL